MIFVTFMLCNASYNLLKIILMTLECPFQISRVGLKAFDFFESGVDYLARGDEGRMDGMEEDLSS